MIAWHYTVGQAAVLIVRSGHLEARPVVWFSTRQDVDPSACRSLMRARAPYRLSVGEMHRLHAGWFRFGLPAAGLVQAEQVRTLTHAPRDVWRQRVAVARAHGADVRQWFASFERVEVARCHVERLDGHPAHGSWVPIADPVDWFSAKLDEAIALEWAKAISGPVA